MPSAGSVTDSNGPAVDIELQQSTHEDVGSEIPQCDPLLECYAPGYPRLAAFSAFDQDLMVFRGFKRVHARLLLHLQSDIQALESELDRMDSQIAVAPTTVAADESRKAVFDKLLPKISQYGKSRERAGTTSH